MPTVKYLYSGAGGSCYLDCEVIAQLDGNRFEVRFYDDVMEAFVTKVTTGDRLTFPSFSDLVM